MVLMVSLYVHQCLSHTPVLLFELNLFGMGIDAECLKLFLQLSQLGMDSVNMTAECCCVGLLEIDCLKDSQCFQKQLSLGVQILFGGQFADCESDQEVCEPKLTAEQLLEIESCQEYVKTPFQTLDGIYVHQPKRFLPLAKETKKLTEALKKEQDTAQWARIPPEKLLQESFIEQLNSIQALEQLAPLHAAREHLPQDIINETFRCVHIHWYPEC